MMPPYFRWHCVDYKFDCVISLVACYAAGHRSFYKQDLHRFDVLQRRLLRSVVRPPRNVDWTQPWHEILHQWNGFVIVSKPRVSDTWAWHTGALLALCETKGLRQDFPLLQVGKKGLIKVSTPDHSGCKFVHLGPPGILWASSALRLFSNPGPKGLTRKHALPPHISGRQSCNLSKKH